MIWTGVAPLVSRNSSRTEPLCYRGGGSQRAARIDHPAPSFPCVMATLAKTNACTEADFGERAFSVAVNLRSRSPLLARIGRCTDEMRAKLGTGWWVARFFFDPRPLAMK